MYPYFNPRTHMGCDAAKFKLAVNDLLFQSTHPHGVRRDAMRMMSHGMTFQSTHPHGVRLALSFTIAARLRYFNPRTHMGCDLLLFFFAP